MKQLPVGIAFLVIVVVSVNLAGLVAFILPKRTYSRRPQSITNAKQTGTGHQIYLADYDDVFPPTQSMPTQRALLHPYLRNPQLWLNDKHLPSIQMNFAASGVRASTVSDPEKALLLTNDWFMGGENKTGGTIRSSIDSSTRWMRLDDPEYLRQRDRQFPRATQTFFPPDYLADQDPCVKYLKKESPAR